MMGSSTGLPLRVFPAGEGVRDPGSLPGSPISLLVVAPGGGAPWGSLGV